VLDGAFVYDLYFQALSDAADDDALFVADTLGGGAGRERRPAAGGPPRVVRGGLGGLVLVNPNLPRPRSWPRRPVRGAGGRARGPAGRAGGGRARERGQPLDRRARRRADLVAMDEAEGIAYLRLSGGCQGCAMSRMT